MEKGGEIHLYQHGTWPWQSTWFLSLFCASIDHRPAPSLQSSHSLDFLLALSCYLIIFPALYTDPMPVFSHSSSILSSLLSIWSLCVNTLSSITIKKKDWKTWFLKGKKQDLHSFPGAAAYSIVLSAWKLPDYARPRHTQSSQSMPPAMLPLCTHLCASPWPMNTIFGSLVLTLKMDTTVSNPSRSHLEHKEIDFGWNVIFTITRRNEIWQSYIGS